MDVRTKRDERFADWLTSLPELPLTTTDLKQVWDAGWEAALEAVLAQAPTEDAASDAQAGWRDRLASQQRPVPDDQRDWSTLDQRNRELFFAAAARAISGAVHRIGEEPASTAA